MADLYEVITRNETTKSKTQPAILPLRDVNDLNEFYSKLNLYNEEDVMFPHDRKVIGIIGVNRFQSGIYQLDITAAKMRGATLNLTLVDKIPDGFQGGSMLSVAGNPILVASIPYNTRTVNAIYTPSTGRGQTFEQMTLKATF